MWKLRCLTCLTGAAEQEIRGTRNSHTRAVEYTPTAGSLPSQIGLEHLRCRFAYDGIGSDRLEAGARVGASIASRFVPLPFNKPHQTLQASCKLVRAARRDLQCQPVPRDHSRFRHHFLATHSPIRTRGTSRPSHVRRPGQKTQSMILTPRLEGCHHRSTVHRHGLMSMRFTRDHLMKQKSRSGRTV